MGQIVKIAKTLYGKVNWNIIKPILLNILKKTFKIKENNTEVKIDRKFIKEFIYSKYSTFANIKFKTVKVNLASHIQELIENCGHIEYEENQKIKHNDDASFGFEKYKCRFILEDKANNINQEYTCIIVVRCPNFKEKYLYDIIDIKKAGPPQRCNM